MMGKIKDRTGKIIGKYKILYTEGLNKKHEMTYAALCLDCGFVLHGFTYSDIKNRSNGSCSHSGITRRGVRWSFKRLGKIYYAMIQRCNNPNDGSYYNYGARGIKVCKEWENDPQSFNDWAIDNGYDNTLTIDRIDNYKGYSPDNCRWVTKSFNSKHKRRTNFITVNGITHTPHDWEVIIGLTNTRLGHVICDKGIDEAKRIIKDYLDHGKLPKTFKHEPITVDGLTMTAHEWCEYLGIPCKTYLNEYKSLHGKLATIDRIREIMYDDAAYTYAKRKKRTITVDGITKNIPTWCKELGLKYTSLNNIFTRDKNRAVDIITKAKHDADAKSGPLVIKLGK